MKTNNKKKGLKTFVKKLRRKYTIEERFFILKRVEKDLLKDTSYIIAPRYDDLFYFDDPNYMEDNERRAVNRERGEIRRKIYKRYIDYFLKGGTVHQELLIEQAQEKKSSLKKMSMILGQLKNIFDKQNDEVILTELDGIGDLNKPSNEKQDILATNEEFVKAYDILKTEFNRIVEAKQHEEDFRSMSELMWEQRQYEEPLVGFVENCPVCESSPCMCSDPF